MLSFQYCAKYGLNKGLAAKRLLSTASQTDMERFVVNAMNKSGLAQYTDHTIQALKGAMVVNNDLLFKLNDQDWKESGVPLGAARAIQEEIAYSKRAAVEHQEGRRSRMRREQSMKEKRKL